ncbi:MAG: hypothetical protein EOO71_04475 [Myxococcaceae bacterium]|nr:MAG: hypothetical protein EOO71_04475 [Myxococcaceae bacterium]
MSAQVLIAEDESHIAESLGFILERAGSVSFEYYSKAQSAANSGKLKAVNHSADFSTTYTYDGFGRIQTAITASTLLILRRTYLSITYTYDNTTGHLTRAVYASEERPQDVALNRQVDYQYDGLGQLIQEKESVSGTPRSSRTYAYDVAGNVVKRTLTRTGKPDETTLFEYDADNKLVSLKLQNGSTRALQHDLLGNITDDGAGRKFRYNALGQLTGFVGNPSNSCTYDYHPDGLRQGKYRADGTALRFHYDGEPVPNIVNESHGKLSTGPGGVTFEADIQFTNALVDSQRVARRDPRPNQTRQLLLEDQGHVIAQLTHSGPILLGENQISSNHFSAYGERDDASGEAQNGFELKVNPFGFKGEYRDAESGLIYMRARYYDPELLRFLSRDSFPFFNPYNYVSGNPVMLSDPTGQFDVTAALIKQRAKAGLGSGSQWASGGSGKSSIDGWAVAGIVAGLAAAVLTVGIGGLIAGATISTLAGVALAGAAGAAAAVADRVVNAIHQSVDGNGSFSDNFFNLETLKSVGIGLGVGLLSAGLSVGLGAASRGLSTLATRGDGLAFRALGSLIGNQGVRSAAAYAARGFEAFSAAAALDLFAKGTIEFNSSFVLTVAAGIAGGHLGPRAQNGAGRIREAWDAKLIRKNLGANAYAARLLGRTNTPVAVVGSVEPSRAFALEA